MQMEYFEQKKRLDAQVPEQNKNSLENYPVDKILHMPRHLDLDDVLRELLAH